MSLKIKPLIWESSPGNYSGQEVWSAGDPWLFWIVSNRPGEFIWCECLNLDGMVPASPVRGSFRTLEAAQLAAQIDFNVRLCSWIEDLDSPAEDVVRLEQELAIKEAQIKTLSAIVAGVEDMQDLEGFERLVKAWRAASDAKGDDHGQR